MRCGGMACSHNCIGMCEWTGCSGALHLDAPTPRPTDVTAAPPLSTGASSSKQKQPHLLSEEVKRFDFASDEDLSELTKGLVPHSAAKSTQWAVKNFEDWRNARNACHPDNPIPHNALDSCDPEVINLQLSRFIVVTRKSNGERYPPSSLHQLLCGLLRSMREKNPECPNFLDKKDVRFKRIQGTLDAYFHKLHSEGIGRRVKHAETISTEEENTCMLWDAGIMNTHTPLGLQNAVFYAIGKTFCLRGGQEHRTLKLSQLQRDSDKYVYHENVSKNRNGSFKQLHIKSKVVPVYPCPEAGERCPVYLLDLYISKLPEEHKRRIYCMYVHFRKKHLIQVNHGTHLFQ